MFDQGKVVSLIPGQSGKGGTKTAVPSMDGLPDIRDARNIMVKNGRWENILGFTTIRAAYGPRSNSSLYCYAYHVTSVPVTTTVKLLASGIKLGSGYLFNMTDGSVVLNLTDGGVPMSFETVKEKCYFADGATTPQVLDGPNGLITYIWGIRDGIGSPTSPSDPTPFGGMITLTYDTAAIELTDTFDITAGNEVITLNTGPALQAAYQGKSIWLMGDENSKPANRHDIVAVDVAGGHLTIDPIPTKDEIGGVASVTAAASQINYGNMTWTMGAPAYAMSFYDSTRGHSGNIGATATPPDAAKYCVNVKVQFTGDTTGDLSRCDQVILWSTPAFVNGAVMYTLSVQNNFSGSIQYLDNRADDSGLGIELGPFPAPINGSNVANSRPKTYTSIAYWNGVMWGLAPTGPDPSDFDLSLLYYSRRDDPSILGRGEESWPAGNFLRIPAKDGRGLGLVVVGDTLCVLTERYIYTVVGTSDGSYRLAILSSRGFGVGQFQMAEYTGDATTQTAAMIYMGQDRQVWAQAIGDVPISISPPIQDQLDAALRGSVNSALYPNTRVHYITYSGDTYAVILLN